MIKVKIPSKKYDHCNQCKGTGLIKHQCQPFICKTIKHAANKINKDKTKNEVRQCQFCKAYWYVCIGTNWIEGITQWDKIGFKLTKDWRSE